MFLEEGLNELDVHSVVLVGVGLKSRGLEHLVSSTASVQELGILLIVVSQAGDLATLPCHMTKIHGPIKSEEEEHAIGKNAPLADVLELYGIGCLHHFFYNASIILL